MVSNTRKRFLIVVSVIAILAAVPVTGWLVKLKTGPEITPGNTAAQVESLNDRFLAETAVCNIGLQCLNSLYLTFIPGVFQGWMFLSSPNFNKYGSCFLELGKREPQTQAGLHALLSACSSNAPNARAEAFPLLVQYHPDADELSGALIRIMRDDPLATTPQINQLIEKTKNPLVAATARQVLGQRAIWSRRNDEARKQFEKALEEIKQVKNSGGTEPAFTDFMKLRLYNSKISAGGLKKKIDSALFEATHLAIGTTAPEIEGISQNRTKMRLSDFRKKVVFLDFWGDG